MILDNGYLVPIPEQTRNLEGSPATFHRLKLFARMPHQALQSTGRASKIRQGTQGSLTGNRHSVRNPVDRAHRTPRIRDLSLCYC